MHFISFQTRKKPKIAFCNRSQCDFFFLKINLSAIEKVINNYLVRNVLFSNLLFIFFCFC